MQCYGLSYIICLLTISLSLSLSLSIYLSIYIYIYIMSSVPHSYRCVFVVDTNGLVGDVHAMPCHATSRHVTSRHATSRHVSLQRFERQRHLRGDEIHSVPKRRRRARSKNAASAGGTVFSICARRPCAGAMLIFAVSLQF